MRVHDPKFIEAVYRQYRLPVPHARDVEITNYDGPAGYCIEILDGKRSLAAIAWCPLIEQRAYAINGLPRGRADQTALNTLIVDFLQRHRFGMSDDDCAVMTKRVMRLMRKALAERNWTIARQLWSIMSPMHASLIEDEPLCAHLDTLLAQNEAADGPCSSVIH